MDESSPPEQQAREHFTLQERLGTSTSIVEAHYDTEAHLEWQRLERHRMEFAITMHALAEYLPRIPQTVLDVGGGPGRYALALASLGHWVTLLDLSQSNLALAHQKAEEDGIFLEQVVHGNALDLSTFPSETFDSVLLLGPLYHLLTEPEREQAVCEAWRVLSPGGLIFAAFITRYAAFRSLARLAPAKLLERRAAWEAFLETGVYRGGQEIGFTDAYFAHPDEIKPLMQGVGFESLDLLACEGILADNEEQVNQLTGEAWQTWVDLNYQLSKDPSLYGAAYHLLYVGRKPEA